MKRESSPDAQRAACERLRPLSSLGTHRGAVRVLGGSCTGKRIIIGRTLPVPQHNTPAVQPASTHPAMLFLARHPYSVATPWKGDGYASHLSLALYLALLDPVPACVGPCDRQDGCPRGGGCPTTHPFGPAERNTHFQISRCWQISGSNFGTVAWPAAYSFVFSLESFSRMNASISVALASRRHCSL